MTNLKKYPIYSDWFDEWRNRRGAWPQASKTRTAAGLLVLWSKNAVSTLEEVAELADMTVNSLRVARTEKIFKLVCQNAAIDFSSYLFIECGLSYLKENETELFHTLDGLNEEAAKVIFSIVSYPDAGVDADDKSTCDAYLAARDFLLQVSWLTLSKSKNSEMTWQTRAEAARLLDHQLAYLRELQKFYVKFRQDGGSVTPPSGRKFWKE